MAKSHRKMINRPEIETSLEKFLAKGGEISVLPAQKIFTRHVIDGDKWGSYISFSDDLFYPLAEKVV